MNAFLLMTGSGPLVVLTTHESPLAEGFLKKLALKGIDKFMAYSLDDELVHDRYGRHYGAVLDHNGFRAFHRFSFDEMGEPVLYEAHPEDPKKMHFM
jgi:hypothetical protein